MINKKLMLTIFFVCIAFLTGCKNESKVIPTIVIPGTGASEQILKILAEKFNSEYKNIQVLVPESSGSSGGITSVVNDEAKIARIARKLKPEEEDKGLEYHAFAKDAVVFAVSKDVAVKSLSEKQLIGIFSGSIKNWKQINGVDATINVFIREDTDSSLDIIRKNISDFKNIEFSKQAKMQYHDNEMVEVLGSQINSIGWLTKSSIRNNENIKMLAIDGVEPISTNIEKGNYKLVAEYAFVYKKDKLDSNVKTFLEFVKSKSGYEILEGNDLLISQ